MKYSLRPTAVTRSVKSFVALGLATLLTTTGLLGAAPYFISTAAAATTVEACTTITPTCLQDAINAADPGDTVNITSDLVTSAQVNITESLTIEGNGHTVTAGFSRVDNSNNSVIGVLSTSNVTINDLIVDANHPTSVDLHGINVYRSTGVLINGSTAKNGRTGVVVNGSSVTLNNHTSENNLWHGINVDKGTIINPANLTITGESTHSGDAYALYLDIPANTNNSVTDNTLTQQYTETAPGSGAYTAADPDMAKPTIGFTAPAAGAATKTNVTVSVSASDDRGLNRIGVNVYNQSNTVIVKNCGSTSATTPLNTTNATFDCTIDVGSYVDGIYTLRASARDLVGKVSVTTQQLTIDRVKPTVAVTNPADFSTPFQTGPVVTAQGSDALSGIKSTVLHAYNADNSPAIFCPVSYSDTVTCDLSSLSDGSYYFKAGATDNAGNINVATQAFSIDSTQPKLKISSPTAGDEFRGTVTISGTAQDNGSGIAADTVSIQLREKRGVNACGPNVNAALLATVDSNGDWTTDFDSNTYADGQYCIEATAYDNAGNATVKRVRHITIDNTGANVTVTTPHNNETIDISVIGYDVTGTVTDTLTGVNRVVLLVNDSTGTRAFRDVTRTFVGGNWTIEVPTDSLIDGVYRFNITAYDEVGNPTIIRRTVVVKTAVIPPTLPPAFNPGSNNANPMGTPVVMQILTSGGTISSLTSGTTTSFSGLADEESSDGEVLGTTTNDELSRAGETQSATTNIGNAADEGLDSSRFLGLGWWWVLVLSGVSLLAYYWFIIRKADQ